MNDDARSALRYVPFAAALCTLALAFVFGFWIARATQPRRVDVAALKLARYNACLIEAKHAAATTTFPGGALPPAYSAMLDAFARTEDCGHIAGVPFYSQRDIYDITGVAWRLALPPPTDPAWLHPDVPRNPAIDANNPSGLVLPHRRAAPTPAAP